MCGPWRNCSSADSDQSASARVVSGHQRRSCFRTRRNVRFWRFSDMSKALPLRIKAAVARGFPTPARAVGTPHRWQISVRLRSSRHRHGRRRLASGDEGDNVGAPIAALACPRCLKRPELLAADVGAERRGRELIDSFERLQAIYTIYGIGFAFLSWLYFLLYGHALKRGAVAGLAEEDREEASEARTIWAMITLAGLFSAALAWIIPMRVAPWAPGFACWLGVSFKPFGPLALASQAPAAIILAALRRFRGSVLFHGPRPSSSQGAPFWPSGLTVRRSRPPTAAAELRALVLSYSSLCRPTFIPALRLYPRFLLWVFGALPGFACVRLVGFRPFGPLALV